MMDTTLTLWLAGGAAATLAMMLLVVGIARRLDRDRAAENAPVDKLMSLASRMKSHVGIAHAAGPVVALLAHASADAKSEDGKPVDPRTKKARAALTGMAIAGGILMVIVGILTGKN